MTFLLDFFLSFFFFFFFYFDPHEWQLKLYKEIMKWQILGWNKSSSGKQIIHFSCEPLYFKNMSSFKKKGGGSW